MTGNFLCCTGLPDTENLMNDPTPFNMIYIEVIEVHKSWASRADFPMQQLVVN